MNLKTVFEFELWGNTGEQFFWALVIFIVLMIIFKIFSSIVIAKLRKASKLTETDVDDFLIDVVKYIRPPFYFCISFFVATQFLALNQVVNKAIFGVFVIVVVFQVVSTVQKVVDYVIRKKLIKPEDEKDVDKEMIIHLAGQTIKASLWVFGVLLILSNLGINITSLIAGLGIGGVALALAAQSIIGDVFASISIFIDKPFRVGDFISLSSGEQGTVEKIGIKTSRLRTKQGQQLIVANKMLTDATIQNFQRMESRQTSFLVSVVYEVSGEKLRRVPGIIKEIIEKQDHASVGRVFLKELGEFSINFEVVFKMDDPKFAEYAKAREAINLGILEAFKKENIGLAYPTQTLIVQQESKSGKKQHENNFT